MRFGSLVKWGFINNYDPPTTLEDCVNCLLIRNAKYVKTADTQPSSVNFASQCAGLESSRRVRTENA